MRSPTQLLQQLQTYPIWQAIDAQVLLALINGGRQLVCAENSRLYLRGDAAACIYIVIEGQLASFGEWQSEQVLLHHHFAGDVLGYVLFDEQAQRSATVASVSQAVLLEIPVSVVDALFAQIPGAIKGQIQEDPTMFQLRLALRLSELFKGLDETEFRALESLLAVTSASCGTVRCFQGDPSDRLFIIVSGRMQVGGLPICIKTLRWSVRWHWGIRWGNWG